MPLPPKPLIAKTLTPGTQYVQDQTNGVHRNIVYALADPRTTDIHFVGRSSLGLMTPLSYLCPSNRAHHAPVECWIATLLTQGVTPDVYVLEECASKADLKAAKKRWVDHLKAQGIPLLNRKSVWRS